MDTIIGIISVFLVSVIELWLGIPLGFYLELNILLIIISAAAGSILSAVLVVILGENIRNHLLKRKYSKKSPKEGRIYDIWRKYGVIGLGLLSPLFFGAPLGAALGVVFGAARDRLLLWMAIGIIIWSIILTTAGYLGIMGVQSIIK